MQDARRAVDVHARDGDDPSGVTTKNVHQRRGLAPGAQNKIHDDVGAEGAKRGRTLRQTPPVTSNRPNTGGWRSGALRPMQDGDFMAGVEQPRDQRAADEPSTADHEYAHID
jgi:hypothetical protein